MLYRAKDRKVELSSFCEGPSSQTDPLSFWAEEGGHDVTLEQQLACSDYIPNAKILMQVKRI